MRAITPRDGNGPSLGLWEPDWNYRYLCRQLIKLGLFGTRMGNNREE
jgi:hypothetical protein